MPDNHRIRIHVINVGHGDSLLVEFPDGPGGRPRFGLVDAGGEQGLADVKTIRYIETFLRCRLGLADDQDPLTTGDHAFDFEFICLTHPHQDHLYGILEVLEAFYRDGVPIAHRPKQFWDSGFRFNTDAYLAILQFLAQERVTTQFVQVTSGTEFHFADVEVLVLGPSVDLRNRYDTYGVGVNNASIVLRICKQTGPVAVLAGDAEFDSWGKICEEFPRRANIHYAVEMDVNPYVSRDNQLKCSFLKVSHHGSKNGTSYEYLDKLKPNYVAMTTDSHGKRDERKFPHPITRVLLAEELADLTLDLSDPAVPTNQGLCDCPRVGNTALCGSMVYAFWGNSLRRKDLGDGRDNLVTGAQLGQALAGL